MSTYTITIHQLIKSGFDFGLKDYPVFDESYRIPLNNKILEHYRFREIGFETPEMFKFFLNRTLNEIMPYYNDLWETTLLEFDPLTNYNMVEKILFSGTEDTGSNEHSQGSNSGNSETTQNNTTTNTANNTSITNNVNNNIVDATRTPNTEAKRTYNDYTTTESQDGVDTVETDKTLKYSDTPQTDIDFIDVQTGAYMTNANIEHNIVTTTPRAGKTTTQVGGYTDKTTGSDKTLTKDDTTSRSDTTDTSTLTTSENLSNVAETTNEYINDIANKILKAIENETNSQKKGYQGITPMELIKQMRDLILNIELMIIDDLANLFMQIY